MIRESVFKFGNTHQIKLMKYERAYLKWGPYQLRLENDPLSGKDDHPKRFQYTWFSLFPSWLEYSPLKNVGYCLLCYLFSKKPSGRPDLVKK